ncbi:putative SLC9B1-like protein SLC9B1P1 [Neodiprion lecontei]|uniref:SLC9B1-like protein SLC9B1P1 n=1 Tax=Neodiprion lecontei TaxID=441921 RepID=A0ABM3FIM3_NEOLC|nr:putative SLC9B1-like protein SLC9B1P1 [Neodiprion pinetum]XP_046587876.1 putative SLC9B1-like protein SLC9B1P1 [Neodiprion lecontei]
MKSGSNATPQIPATSTDQEDNEAGPTSSEISYEDLACCGKATCCVCFRDVSVTSPLVKRCEAVTWGTIFWSVIACMSPVVTVNCLLALADQGFGEDKDISGTLCAACSIDGVHIVAIFSIAFSVVFDDFEGAKWWSYLPRGLRDMAFGIFVGSSLGLFLVFFPHQSHKYATFYRILNLSLGALCFSVGASSFVITGGGFLATVIMSFIVCTGWKIIVNKFDVAPIRKVVGIIWHILQPVLCGVIGADVNFSHWTAIRTGLYAACILTGLLARLTCAILSTIKMPFTIGERIFVAVSWLPKGTVQAALAPMAYEHALAKNNTRELELAEDVLKVSVLAILFLAPIGAMIMMMTGPHLLSRISSDAMEERRLQSLRTLSMKVKVKKPDT